MYAVIWTFQARSGDEDAVLALYEMANAPVQPHHPVEPVCRLLLQRVSDDVARNDTHGFLALAHFTTRKELDAWMQSRARREHSHRLATMIERTPDTAIYRVAWQSGTPSIAGGDETFDAERV